ncbi:hypothetical protein ANSO36C_24670 [Nostoc cf. commune SO-36]|uniref:Uncharacterized protein n=1 Tax=Nostoc cf. commune SO-36 TaxID=449208 RepID=A0ABM7Z111_NOSCO|nr:hypothetical protein [Nostoc commune]BDI16665.1 hypothetical protein ANSO36C_24670 [Nostoc cf. commune SO-36]
MHKSNRPPLIPSGKITISGKDGADAKRYQEKEVKQAIEEVEGKEKDE